jgi:hypothetical protein
VSAPSTGPAVRDAERQFGSAGLPRSYRVAVAASHGCNHAADAEQRPGGGGCFTL